jgi:hypothetical protein
MTQPAAGSAAGSSTCTSLQQQQQQQQQGKGLIAHHVLHVTWQCFAEVACK